MGKRIHNTSAVRSAFTLIELLIAMALTLILVYAIAEFYAYVGNAVRDSRAMIELGGQLRSVGQQLQDDLDSLTLRPEPWIDPNASPGYFTIYEGPYSDSRPDSGTNDITTINTNQIPDVVNNNVTTLVGDGDDVIAMTIRAGDVPFQGRYNGGTQTSQFAEVVWFATFTDTNGDGDWDLGEPRLLCRRQLIIRPDLGVLGTYGTLSNAIDFWDDNDVSARISYNSTSMQFQVVANSLADLSLRENRFGCALQGNGTAINSTSWKEIDIKPSDVNSLNVYTLSGNAFGEDRVLSNVLAFDIRAFDPTAPIYEDSSSQTALTPGDPGFAALFGSGTPTRIGVGAWVDLYYNQVLAAQGVAAGSRPSSSFSGSSGASIPFWDTWPLAYELPPYNTGTGLDGLDTDGVNGVDDAGERQTQPPYAAPLRGVQVRIRVYEPQTRQARQITVGTDFIPE
ncbi:hypothetical protein ETAA8_63970 [Anatilimnocola aggregata]|uniref:Prepilin-type N-terminal cleavage/methylation domain-containing protein n=1 Tax=Anatilimnocola aggregata TaxID=2528021 RepID=A0A517YLZ6_9BACT|nr:prepilin-type N-terminal cleavage/methylation domain-containing protein [Anatilimnocola aggregata]QDU31244.1 hypothetical protein ETAA8_63970 [Anatilimnocola aggregata]